LGIIASEEMLCKRNPVYWHILDREAALGKMLVLFES